MSTTKLGAHFASPFDSDGGWDYMLDIFKRGRFTAAKVMIPPGFGWEPHHVEQLIAAGAQEIILRTEDDDYVPERVRTELVDRGFYSVVQRYGGVQFILEVGNEQNLARDSKGRPNPMDPWSGRFWLLKTRHELSDLDRPNLRWVASFPTALDEVKTYMSRTSEDFVDETVAIPDLYDGLAIHLYGHFHVDDGGGGDWIRIYDYLRATTQLPLYVTEFGINHIFDDPEEKAKRYLQWLSGLNDKRVPSAYVYWVGKGERHLSYQVSPEMADQLAVYGPEPGETQPLLTMADAVRRLQEWAAAQDPDFFPIDFDEED